MDPDLNQIIRSLSYEEAYVLYWKIHGRNEIQIAKHFDHKYDWTRKKIKILYQKFGWTGLKDDQKGSELVVRAKPIIDSLVAGNPERLRDWPLDRPKAEKETELPPRPAENAVVPPVVPPSQPTPEPAPTEPSSSAAPGPSTTDWRAILSGLLGVGVVLLIAYFIFRPRLALTPEATATVTVSSQAGQAPNPMPSSATATTLLSTDTPPPPALTFTPIRTPEFYGEMQWAPLTDGVHIRMQNNFSGLGGICGRPDPGFGVFLGFNIPQGSYSLKFDPQAFSATDDVGTSYTLAWVGMHSNACKEMAGFQRLNIGSNDWIFIGFSGTVPPGAHYLIITAGNINGLRLVFHKGL